MITPADINSKILPDDFTPAMKREKRIKSISHFIVLILSLGLIVFISYDTFKNINFLQNKLYMTFQFWVCIIFLCDFFLEWWLSDDRKSYLAGHWFYFLISIPYLNIIDMGNIQFSMEQLYYIRFIPLVRGAYALALVVGYFSTNRAYSLLTQYAAILLSVVYFSSIIFYYEERNVNSDVNTYWDALYWAAMNCDTVGSYINAVTIGGKVLSVVLAVSGMMMLPLFTVFITEKVKDSNARERMREAQLHALMDAKKSPQPNPTPDNSSSSSTSQAANVSPGDQSADTSIQSITSKDNIPQ